MHITFIGTGSGKTILNRYHSSILIDCDDHILLVDAGDGVSRALLNQNVDLLKIDSIIISHFHPDHIGGISSLVNQMKILNRENPLAIYLDKNLFDTFYTLLNINYIFPEKLKFTLNVNSFNSDSEITVAEKIKFTAKQNSHITNKHNIEYISSSAFISSSFLIRLDGHNIVYTADIGSIDDMYLFTVQKIDLLITETTHINYESIIETIKKLKPGRTYLTHIDDNDEAALVNSIASHNSSNIFMAYDGLKITF